jgi:hypothetical protein
LHNKAPSYSAAIVKQFLVNRKVAVLYHTPYSSHLIHSDYFLFPYTQIFLERLAFIDHNRNSECKYNGTGQRSKRGLPRRDKRIV